MSRSFRIRDACLVLADGRLPAVGDITDPVTLGVHRGRAVAEEAAVSGSPTYVARGVDGELLKRLAGGGFVPVAEIRQQVRAGRLSKQSKPRWLITC